MYHILLKFILREMPKSFTYGEAAIITQGVIIFLSNSCIKLIVNVKNPSQCLDDDRTFLWTMEQKNTCEMEQLTTILQVR